MFDYILGIVSVCLCFGHSFYIVCRITVFSTYNIYRLIWCYPLFISRGKCCFWILCICLQFTIWLCENTNTEDAAWCQWKVSLHWVIRLCHEDSEVRWSFQILHWISCLLCENCSACHGKICLFPSEFLIIASLTHWIISLDMWMIKRDVLQMTWIFLNQIQKVEKSMGL